jgi:O-antigen/teichoic acid export membrane protein
MSLSLPLLPAIAATWVAEFANRGVLIGSAGAPELGYFSVALRFASIAALVVAAFQLAWQPRAFALGTGPAALVHTARDAHRIALVVSGAVVVIAVASPELVGVVSGPAFAPSLPALGISLCGVLATAVYLVASMPSALGNRFRDIGVSGTVGVVVGVVLNVLLAPRLGSSGTALATLAGQAVAAGQVWLMGRGSVALPVPWGRTLTVGIAASLMALACTLPAGGTPLVLRGLILVGFGVTVWRDGALRPLLASVRLRGG